MPAGENGSSSLQDSTARERRRKRQAHREVLCVAVLAVSLALLLQVRPDGRVAFLGFPNNPLPHACVSRVCFGFPCPLCGLTRSFIHLAHGDWSQSMQAHRLGWFVAIALLLQIPYRLLALRDPKHEAWGSRFSGAAAALCAILLLAEWALG
jgi:hydrogenase/urease accessory protein HupE